MCEGLCWKYLTRGIIYVEKYRNRDRKGGMRSDYGGPGKSDRRLGLIWIARGGY